VISVTANVAPKRIKDMVQLCLDGKWDQARSIHRELYGLSKSMFIETNPIPVKTALGMMGKIRPEVRLPLCEMSEANQKILRQSLEKAGVV